MILLDELNKTQRTYFEMMKKTLNKDSKFYGNDVNSLIQVIKRKTYEQLMESIKRQNSINDVSLEEINENCQFEGLFK